MQRRLPPWLGRMLFALPFAAFGAFTVRGAAAVAAIGSADWWTRYLIGWVFLGAAWWFVLAFSASPSPAMRWLRTLADVVFLGLFLLPVNLVAFVLPLEGTGQLGVVTFSGLAGRGVQRVLLALAALIFDLFWVALGVRLIRKTVALWRGEDERPRRRLP